MPQSRRQLRTNRRAKRTNAPWKVAARKPRGGQVRGTILMTICLDAIRKQLQHNQAMVMRYAENPVQMAASLEAHARAATRCWISLHALAIDGQREAQAAIQTLCGEFGVESILDLENQCLQL